MGDSDDTGGTADLFGGTIPNAVWWIIAACLLPELVLVGADLGLWGQPWWRLLTYQYGGFWPGLLGNWQPNYAAQPGLMFLTYGFLHAGFWHLLVNMVTLLVLAGPVAARFGARGFRWLFGVSLLGGAIGFAGLASTPTPMVGASGALFGLAGALLAAEFDRRIICGRPIRNVLAMIVGLAAGNALLTWTSGGNLAWQTHLGGFVSGWLYATFAGPTRVTGTRVQRPILAKMRS